MRIGELGGKFLVDLGGGILHAHATNLDTLHGDARVDPAKRGEDVDARIYEQKRDDDEDRDHDLEVRLGIGDELVRGAWGCVLRACPFRAHGIGLAACVREKRPNALRAD